MKNYTIFAILTLFLSVFLLTGFQCASQEMTSAKLYIQRSEFEKAEEFLTKEVAKNPINTEAWYLLGNTRMQRANYKGAVEAYDNSLKNSNEFAEKIHPAKKYAWSQMLNMGVNYYNLSLKVSPDSAKMFREKSIGSYKDALKVNPDSAISYQNLAAAYRADGNLDEEINTLIECIKRKPSISIQTLLINSYLQKAQEAEVKSDKQTAAANYSKAVDAILEARKMSPENTELLSTMIDIQVRLGKANEAMPYIREALKQDPNNKIYQYDLGVLLMQTDALDEAISYFDNALKIDPKYEVALQNIGVAYMRVGAKMKEASQSTDAKQTTDKKYIEKFKKATEYFQQLTDVKPEDPNAWDLLASSCANANMVKEAKDALEKADALRKK